MLPKRTIPKIIHFIWLQGVESMPPELECNARQWQALNKNWRVVVWDLASLTRFIQTHYRTLLAPWQALNSVIKKCDVARLLLLHAQGGVYADVDLSPHRSMDDFLLDRVIYCRQHFGTGTLPLPHLMEPIKMDERDVILTREYRPVQGIGLTVANGIILSRPGMDIWLRFVKERLKDANAAVLDFCGPWALSRFVKANLADLQGRCTVLPPYYFLWEQQHFTEARPSWVVSTHQAHNYWGDHSKPDFWNTQG